MYYRSHSHDSAQQVASVRVKRLLVCRTHGMTEGFRLGGLVAKDGPGVK